MRKIYSVEEIQDIEKKEFKKLKSSYVLMKRAGTNCAEKIYKSKLNSKFIVLCGPGNNGGDGILIAKNLLGQKCHVSILAPLGYGKSEDYKKALINADNILENDLLEVLSPIINSESVWKSHALFLLGEYFYSKNEKLKSKEFFSELITLTNANQDLKKKAQKRKKKSK